MNQTGQERYFDGSCSILYPKGDNWELCDITYAPVFYGAFTIAKEMRYISANNH